MVLVELCCVLKRLYGATHDELKATVQDLLDTPQLHLERRDVVQTTVGRTKGAASARAGFVDALIAQLASAEGCSRTLSFDKAAVREAGMVLLA